MPQASFPSREAQRRAISALFFLHGICFSSWASRIPDLQQQLQLSDPALGFLLFFIPVGDLMTMPFSGWITTRLGSRRLSVYSMIAYSFVLACLGWASNVHLLVVGMLALGMTSNLVNICVNTQSVEVQKLYPSSILAAFHGLWSLAGFTGALVGTLMIGLHVPPAIHFSCVSITIVLTSFLLPPYLAKDEGVKKKKAEIFVWPSRLLVLLGFLGCCCMICEGAMFDWSGIYFKKIVGAPKEWIGVGYATFMATMAIGRFCSDYFITRYGIRPVLQVSGLLIASGLLLSVAWPYFVGATFGFFLVGFGVAPVVPIVYGQAGKSKEVPPPIALAIVTTIGFIGFLGGPTLIGTVAGLFSLRISFLLIAIMGALVGILGKYVVEDKSTQGHDT